MSSHLNLMEGVSLWSRVETGHNAYAGALCHEQPLLLAACRLLCHWPYVWQLVYVALSVLSALLVERAASLLFLQLKFESKVPRNACSPAATDDSAYVALALFVALFEPFGLLSYIALSPALIVNCAVLGALVLSLQGDTVIASVCVAFAGYLAAYPLLLVLPVAAAIQSASSSSTSLFNVLARVCALTGASLAAMLGASYVLMGGSWQFLAATHGDMMRVADLTPNLGLSWYLFTEMFDEFRDFYTFALQLNLVVFAVPLAVRLHRQPLFLMWMFVSVSTVLRPYPTFADLSLQLVLLVLLRSRLAKLRHAFVLLAVVAFLFLLAPLFWHMWIYTGTGNANFYYAMSLVLTAAQVVLISTLLNDALERQYLVDKRDKLSPQIKAKVE
jgi:GPI-anchor transamidase subunit U